ncbi:metal ABC transporter ATP-binding protein [Prochlorothrix hollandica]|uniref:metal ABC transporter ATP-binding protein n=1 Tax=Prochlorothrix hollandica TaxID=1223 RepID=UPI003342A020
MLDVCHLSAAYPGVPALVDINLRLGPQEWVGLIGPNGAGKSTLIKSILGLLPRRQGQVLWQGKPLRRRAKTVAYVPQRSQVDWDYPITPWQAVLLACSQGWRWQADGAAQERARAALEQVELWDLRRRSIGELSGGQQQRVFLARAIAQNADLFLLDEPFTGVDQRTERILWEVLANLRSAGKALLVCSHTWNESLYRYDRLILLNRQIIADDRPQQVLTWDNLQRAYGDSWGLPPGAFLPGAFLPGAFLPGTFLPSVLNPSLDPSTAAHEKSPNWGAGTLENMQLV